MSFIKRLLRGAQVEKEPAPDLFAMAFNRRAELTAAFVAAHGGTVQAGPFKDLRLPEDSSWGHGGDRLPKLLGAYEQELHPVLEKLSSGYSVDTIINIGCAEGFYAIGLSLLFPKAHVYAFDIDTHAQQICQRSAINNGVADRVSVAGLCDHDTLNSALANAKNALVFCDCEGGELELMDPSKSVGLNNATLIIECHDFMVPGITDKLAERLASTHVVQHVIEGERNPNTHPFQLRSRKLGPLAHCV